MFRSLRSFTNTIWCRLIIILVVACCYTSEVVAQPTEAETKQGETLAELAKKDFTAKKYLEAAGLFLRAYSLTKKPNALFNTARCYQMIGTTKALEASSFHFGEYIFQSNDKEGKEAARKERAKVDDILDKRREKEDKILEAKAEERRSKELRTARPKTTVTVTKPVDPMPRYNLITYTIGGAGVALMITNVVGIFYGRSEMSKLDKMNFGISNAKSIYNTRATELQRQETIFFATGIAGAGLTAWAIVRWRYPPKKDKSWDVSLLLTPEKSGVMFQTSF